MTWTVRHANCLDILPTLPSMSVDAVITDPIYPHINRDYGRIDEAAWHDLMDAVVIQCRRILTDRGSAVFVLEPNCEVEGRMRPWLFEFEARWSRWWGIVQDLYWFRTTGMPQAGGANAGLLKGACKHLVWLGSPDCYRDQAEILWTESDESRMRNQQARCLRARGDDTHTSPSGYRRNRARVHAAAAERGGVVPPNVWPLPHTVVETGYGAETPVALADRLVRYLCPPGGVVLDPFAGGGNIGVAAIRAGRSYLGIEGTARGWMIATSACQAAESERERPAAVGE